MANKTVVFTNYFLNGTSGLTLLLLDPVTAAIGNGAGDTLTAGSNGLFSAVVTEAITGWWNIVVLQGAVVVLEGGKVYFQSDSVGTYVVDDATHVADAVWDEILTGATHNIPTSAGRRLRQLASVIVRAGTAQGPGTGNNQIQLDAGASSINGDYDPGLIFIETGTGAGQARLILQYNGSTKVATVDRDWRVNPDNTSEFVILADAGRESVNEGLAQAATSTTITLNINASSNDDAYNGQLVFIRSGTGQDQIALVEDYVGATKVATIRTRSINGQWSVVPDTTSAYIMIPNLTWTIAEMQSGLATSSGVTSAFTEIKGATWSSSTDTLEAIRDASGLVTVNVTPLQAVVNQLVNGTRVETFIGFTGTVGPITVTDTNNNPVNLSAPCEIIISKKWRGDILVIPNASITRSGASNNQFSFSASGATLIPGEHAWALRRLSDNFVFAYGDWIVKQAAKKD